MNFYLELFLYFLSVLKKKYFEHVWIRIKVWTTGIEMQHNVLHCPYIIFYFCPLRDFGGMLPNPPEVLVRVDIKGQLENIWKIWEGIQKTWSCASPNMMLRQSCSFGGLTEWAVESTFGRCMLWSSWVLFVFSRLG